MRNLTTVKLRLLVNNTDPVKTAKLMGLRYVSDARPGIRRKRVGKNFSYTGSDGKPIRDAETKQRIRALAIPPAWTDVWICPLKNGHIQATGRDAKGRKQYRYHAQWAEMRSQTKYHRLLSFGEALPGIRRRAYEQLRLRGLPRKKVLAAVLQILDKTGIRIGNDEYARANQSFGLTTMRDEHAAIRGSSVRFEFRGKSGQEHRVHLEDPRLARIVKRCQELPGEELFRYVDEQGETQRIDSADVNEAIREFSGQDFTAKDFRTWSGTVQAVLALCGAGPFTSATQAKRNICQAIRIAAERLGNRPPICRKYYVHPAILEAYQDGALLETLERHLRQPQEVAPDTLRPEERAVMSVLQQHAARASASGRKRAMPPAERLAKAG